MGFLVTVFLVFVFISILRRAGEAAKRVKATLPPELWDPSAVPPSHVLRLGDSSAAALPTFGAAHVVEEESSSELMTDETRYDHDLALAEEGDPLERPLPVLSTAPRPLPEAPATLEHEVDWEQEHEIFHRRYVDARPVAAHTAHGLMDELRDPHAARRAVLLAEILGPPLSMRDSRRR